MSRRLIEWLRDEWYWRRGRIKRWARRWNPFYLRGHLANLAQWISVNRGVHDTDWENTADEQCYRYATSILEGYPKPEDVADSYSVKDGTLHIGATGK